MRSADVHEQALGRAEDALARGEPVQVADLIPEMTPAMREANLRAYMADSKVVDAEGRPIVMYHGTARDFDAFESGAIGASNDAGKIGAGFYLTESTGWADGYAGKGDGANVMPVYVSLRNPLVIGPMKGVTLWDRLRGYSEGFGIFDDPVLPGSGNRPNPEWSAKFSAALREAGHDGVVLDYLPGQREVMVLDPRQIKSAIGNSGRFDPNSASLTDPLSNFADAIDQLRQMRNPDAAAQAQPAPPQGRAPEAAAPQGKPRDLRAELIALRKEQNVLNKLLECLNG